MIQKLTLIFAWVAFGFAAFAQPLQVSTLHVQEGLANELVPVQQTLVLRNAGIRPVKVEGVKTYNTYGQSAFSVSPDTFAVAAGDSVSVVISFLPRHNIAHNSEVVFLTRSGGGSLSVDVRGQGRYSNTYYSTTENLSEQALKNALKTRLALNYNSLSYNAIRDQMYMTVDNKKTNGQGATVNTLECLYTATLITSYTDRTDAQLMGFNTEHVFPQGYFNQQLPERSDMFHLYPTLEAPNSARANLPFGVVTTGVTYQSNGTKGSSSLFEPRDYAKGRVARAMMYFVIRYDNYANFFPQQEAILRQWHVTFPPDLIDQRRCNAIYTLQNNRNPFIDYPQFLERISLLAGNSVEAPVNSLDLPVAIAAYDTVYAGYPAFHRFVVVNDGNQPVTLAGWATVDSRLALPSAPSSDTVIAPGDAFWVDIELTLADTGAFQSTFSFTKKWGTSAPQTVSVPVTAWATAVPTAIAPLALEDGWLLRAFTAEVLSLEKGIATNQQAQLLITDIQGRKVAAAVLPKGTNKWDVAYSPLAPGMYQLIIRSNGAQTVQKVFLQP